jgi:hypothetical protein
LESLLSDEDFKEDCQAWLRQQNPESRTPGNLKLYIEGTVFPKLTGHIKKDTISEKTCQNYMHLWGYKYDERKKGVYYDGHERPDVVMYRKEWLKRMFEYQKFMKDFDGDLMDIILEPQLKPGEKEIVQVTHDECYFYANDGQRKIWMREDEDILRSKHQGRSIMVSAFICPCHGLLRLSDEQLQANPHIEDKEALVFRSVQTDGYWKSEHMLDQVRNLRSKLLQRIKLIFRYKNSLYVKKFQYLRYYTLAVLEFFVLINLQITMQWQLMHLLQRE